MNLWRSFVGFTLQKQHEIHPALLLGFGPLCSFSFFPVPKWGGERAVCRAYVLQYCSTAVGKLWFMCGGFAVACATNIWRDSFLAFRGSALGMGIRVLDDSEKDVRAAPFTDSIMYGSLGIKEWSKNMYVCNTKQPLRSWPLPPWSTSPVIAGAYASCSIFDSDLVSKGASYHFIVCFFRSYYIISAVTFSLGQVEILLPKSSILSTALR